ncbi:MAG: hypothetical protein AB1489_30290, partial [Acidobacteriota bacterium]
MVDYNWLGKRIIIYGYCSYFLFTLIALLPYVNSDYCYVDEATLMVDARRLLAGEYHHRDFFGYWGSGNLYLIALVWRCLGQVSYPPIKLLTFITITFTAILLVLITRQFTKRFWLSLLPAIIFANYFAHSFPFTNHHWFASFTSMLFGLMLVRYLLTLRERDLYCCGVSAGISIFFIMHEGVVNIIASILMLITSAVLLDRKITNNSLLRRILIYLAGLTTILLPIIVFYLATGALTQYFYNTFIWPLGNYARAGNVNDIAWAIDLHNWRVTSAVRDPALRAVHFFGTCAVIIALILPILIAITGAALLTSPNTLITYYRIKPSVNLATELATQGEALTKRYNYWVILALMIWAGGFYATPLLSQPRYSQLIWGSLPMFILGVFWIDSIWTACREAIGSRRVVAALLAFCLISFSVVALYKTDRIVSGDESELMGLQSGRMSNHPAVDLINRE